MEKLIIHISGASGSGKTTLSDKLKEQFKSKIVVKDLDNLRDAFIKEFYGNKK
jgi:uridine kinase